MTQAFRKKPILLACIIISIGQLSMGLVYPSLPWIAKDFSISLDQAQLLVSVYLLGFGPSQFIYGPLSDALGRKKILLSGLVIAMLGLLSIIFLSNSFHSMVLGRFIQGIGTGCCAVLARASTRDSYTGKQLPTALSYIAMAASFTPLAAPVIGGFINHYLGWGMVFISLLGYVAFAWLVLLVGFKETMHDKKKIPSPRTMFHQYSELLKSRYFVSFASVSWLNFSLIVTTTSLMPFIMQNQIGMTSDQYALWAIIPTAGLLLGSSLSNRLRPKIGIHSTLKLAPFIQIVGAIWLILCPVQPLWLMIGQFFMVLGNGFSMPCAQAMVMEPYSKRAGAAAAMQGGGQMVVSSIVSMILMAMGLRHVWQLGCVIIVFALITYSNIHRGFKAKASSVEQL
ncbi:multidrug effflux MFS transporter [Vibrio neonatus]|uniref:multidrug effflux MFS transporter n=1 Tax=Vibrio neonatus TaxID=278860 RepID=UPI0021C2C2DE|nr:multidrug effflux MFS transporter [Vibrio neonatus]